MADNIEKKIIVSIETDASQAASGIEDVKKKLETINDVDVNKSVKTLKNELREAQKEAERMFQEFGAGSQQFVNAATKVSALKNDMDELNLSVKNFNPENRMQALVSAASAGVGVLSGVQGAMAAIGVESENATQTIARLQGLMAMGDAINSIGDLKDTWNNVNLMIGQSTILQKANIVTTNLASGAMRLFGVSTVATGTAFKALKVAIAATGIGLLVVAIGTLLPMIMDWIKGTDDAEKSQRRLADAIDAVNRAFDDQISAIQFDTQLQEHRVKVAGGTEAELHKIRQQGLKNEIAALDEKYEAMSFALDRENALGQVSVEEYKKRSDEIAAITRERGKKYTQLMQDGWKEEERVADEGRKKAKEAAEKRKQIAEKAAADAKAIREKDLANLKETQDKIRAIRESAIDEYRKIGKSELELLKMQYDDLLKEVVNGEIKMDALREKLYGKRQADLLKQIETITGGSGGTRGVLDAWYKKKAEEITNRNAQEVEDFLNQFNLDEYEQKKTQIERDFAEKLKIATDAQREELEKLRTSLLADVDAQKNLDNLATQAAAALTRQESASYIKEFEVGMKLVDADDKETARNKIDALENARIDAENAAFEAEKARLGNNQTAIEALTAEHNSRLVGIERDAKDAKLSITQMEIEAKREAVDNIATLMDQAADLAGKHTVAGKALAVASTTISTYQSAQKAYESQFMPLPDPSSPIRGTIAAAVAVMAGIAKVKQILAVKVPGKNGGGGSAGAPQISTAPVINASATAAAGASIQDVRVVNDQNKVIKAFITDRDLKDADEKSNFLNKLNTI